MSKWPDHRVEGFQRDMSTVVREFETFAAEVEEAGSDRLERARSYRYLGNAYFDLAGGSDPKWLERAHVAYSLAESLLEGVENPAEKAKLAYSHGRALLAKSLNCDLRLVEEARERYALALGLARKAVPEAVGTVGKSLAVAEQLIGLLHIRQEICREIEVLAKSHERPCETQETPADNEEAMLFERLLSNLSASAQLKHNNDAGVLAL